ncbi:MAG: chemotaxis protein CheW [Gemmatimonadaceae bacterium]
MSTATATPTTARLARAGKYLTFYLASEEYGVEILKVHEIIGMLPITRVPRTPPFVRGVINLRGKVIPIIDLRERFGMAQDGAEETCIIVVQVRGIQLGVVVDKVSEVLNIAEGDIEPTPSFGVDVNTEYLLGLAKSEGRVRLLLDIDRVLSASEADSVQAASSDDA